MTPDINLILTQPCFKGYTSRGADMGRCNELEAEEQGKFWLQRLRYVDGDYDTEGAYWGGDSPMWCAFTASSRLFVRAQTRSLAMHEILEQYPHLGFRRVSHPA